MNGIINVYKEAGYTSHDVVARLRGILGQKKIGHTGTLDPDAEGVLPICLGTATKVCDLLTNENKTYEALMLLGVETDTQDISGKVLIEKEVTATEEEVKAAVLSFVGEGSQIPPMYSALKIGGKKLYELAREGKTVERKARKIHLFAIDILEVSLPKVRFSVTCSKGTYIRTLCHDIGQRLGCGACMEHLLRSRVGSFSLESSLKLDRIQEMKSVENYSFLQSTDCVFQKLKGLLIRPEGEKRAFNGNFLLFSDLDKDLTANHGWEDGENLRVYHPQGEFLGIWQYQKMTNTLKPVKIFYRKKEK